MLGEQFTSSEASENKVCCFLRVGRRHCDGGGFLVSRQAAYPLRTSSLFSRSRSYGVMNRKTTSAR